ncbi:predicted protein [Chaetomium globosum CBS 148.51]|uniref:Sister chromatid cohesion protein DCC1 n=1 Tax=Chaetomium globosum (strain ATCC 6205 / CBS 148.51 / DSM 1962 / NBRC 6347 / NRRL 1970) TaxID=306901 RepID=Q2H228_CHAGB|nr:uncharacterized protein CHGG_04168 [Chaetomium globosum CBS 148.51]EAQ87549.1 predicted protein [Chaetomium globosum CBS 148.51]
MSIQTSPGIPLSHAPDGTGYKLLELPPELLELLESPDPPTRNALHPSPTAALLRTKSKTYSLRQKNTSNALILLAPTATTTTGDDGTSSSPTAAVVVGGLSTIATVHDTTELVPEDEAAAAPAAKARGKWHEKFGRSR